MASSLNLFADLSKIDIFHVVFIMIVAVVGIHCIMLYLSSEELLTLIYLQCEWREE
jgi:hypothetical protein